MAPRSVSDRTPAPVPESSLLSGPPWFSVFSVVKACLPARPWSPEGLEGLRKRSNFGRIRTGPPGREQLS